MTKSDLILAAMQREIAARRASIDASNELSEVTVTVKFIAGSMKVRGVAYYEERIDRRHYLDNRKT